MRSFFSRFPSADATRDFAYRHRGKLAGLFAGTFGMYIVTMFLVVAITGVPYDGVRLHPDRFIVYPNF